MCRIIIEKRHKFEDDNGKNSAPLHGHIVYRYVENENDEEFVDSECAGELTNDGLAPDELRSSPFDTKEKGYELIGIFLEKGILSIDESEALDIEIDNCELP